MNLCFFCSCRRNSGGKKYTLCWLPCKSLLRDWEAQGSTTCPQCYQGNLSTSGGVRPKRLYFWILLTARNLMIKGTSHCRVGTLSHNKTKLWPGIEVQCECNYFVATACMTHSRARFDLSAGICPVFVLEIQCWFIFFLHELMILSVLFLIPWMLAFPFSLLVFQNL